MATQSIPTKRGMLGIGLIVAFAILFLLIEPYFSFDYLESQRSEYLEYYRDNPSRVILVFMALSALCIGAALPTTGVISLLGGALFGFTVGLIVVSISSAIGSTIVFLWSRYLFREWLQSRFERHFSIINKGIAKEGGYYLFSIRLLMVFPFFLVNILSGLTNIGLKTYVLVTFISQTIVVAVWIYAGATLADFESVDDIVSLRAVFLLALVGLAPLVIHRALLWFRKREGLSR